MYLKKELRLNAGVLIDTWWNVNVDAAIISYLLAQF